MTRNQRMGSRSSHVFKALVFMPLKINIFPLHPFHYRRNMCIARFVPLNIEPDSERKKADIEKLYAMIDSSKEKTKIVCELLDVTEADANDILQCNAYLRRQSASSLKSRINFIQENLQDYPFKFNRTLWIRACGRRTSYFEHRTHFLKEIGMSITYYTLFNLRNKFNTPLRSLLFSEFSFDVDYPQKIFANLGAPTSVMESLPLLSSLKDKTLIEICTIITKLFLKWQLDIPEKIFETIKWNRVNVFCSLKLQAEIINILRNVEFSNEKIIRHLYLLESSPRECEQFLSCPDICGVNSRTLIQRVPSVMVKDIQTIKDIITILDFVNVSEAVMFTYPRIFTHATDGIIKRIVYFIEKTSLDDFRLTPYNIVLLIMNKICSAGIENFEREHGSQKVIPSISKLMNNSFTHRNVFAGINFLHTHLHINRRDALKEIKRIGLMYYPEDYALKQNLVFLLNKGFCIETLRNAYHIVLYPHEIVSENFDNLPNTKYGLKYMQNKDNDKLLQLLLYKVNRAYKVLAESCL